MRMHRLAIVCSMDGKIGSMSVMAGYLNRHGTFSYPSSYDRP
jgi:hypothetical protein